MVGPLQLAPKIPNVVFRTRFELQRYHCLALWNVSFLDTYTCTSCLTVGCTNIMAVPVQLQKHAGQYVPIMFLDPPPHSSRRTGGAASTSGTISTSVHPSRILNLLQPLLATL